MNIKVNKKQRRKMNKMNRQKKVAGIKMDKMVDIFNDMNTIHSLSNTLNLTAKTHNDNIVISHKNKRVTKSYHFTSTKGALLFLRERLASRMGMGVKIQPVKQAQVLSSSSSSPYFGG